MSFPEKLLSFSFAYFNRSMGDRAPQGLRRCWKLLRGDMPRGSVIRSGPTCNEKTMKEFPKKYVPEDLRTAVTYVVRGTGRVGET